LRRSRTAVVSDETGVTFIEVGVGQGKVARRCKVQYAGWFLLHSVHQKLVSLDRSGAANDNVLVHAKRAEMIAHGPPKCFFSSSVQPFCIA